MALNPMQRKARISFFLGMILTLMITGAIIAFLVLQLMTKVKEENAKKLEMVRVYALKYDVESGQEITEDMLEEKEVYKDFVPSNATMDSEILEAWQMQDKEGNEVIVTTTKDSNKCTLSINHNGQTVELKKEEETDNYYVETNGQKETIEINIIPMVAKVNLKKNTVLTKDLITKGDNTLQNDIRKQEYNVAVLPTDLQTGDYVDIRLMFPNGQDFIVVSKKSVEIPNIDGADSIDTFWVNLSEDEILQMSCAIVESARALGSKLYLTKYTDPGIQEKAIPNYIVNPETLRELTSDPNVLQKAKNDILTRLNGNETSVSLRNDINGQVNNPNMDTQSNVQQVIEQSITNSKSTRKQYVDSLSTVE